MATLAGKVAVITGGSKGIDKATALRLARNGAKVVVQYNSDSKGAQEVVDAIGDPDALAVQGNAASVADTEELMRRAVERFSHIDILIANAGSLPYKDLKAAPHLRPGAQVFLVSSTLCHASTVTPRYLLYLSTKGAIEQMVRVLATEVGFKDITVNAVAPGPTDTALFNSGATGPIVSALNSIPRGRLGTPEEIAETWCS